MAGRTGRERVCGMTTTGFGMVNAKMGLLPVSIGVKIYNFNGGVAARAGRMRGKDFIFLDGVGVG